MPEANTSKTIKFPTPAYSPMARALHWITVGFVAVMIPLGFGMAYRGNTLNVWDATTNNLYSTHKMLGFILLWVVIARLVYRLKNGAPRDEPTLEPWQKMLSHLTHWALYGLLILMPIGGWIGVSLYPALDIFGLFKLPALWTPNQAAASTVFLFHFWGAIAIIGLVSMHIGAALYHHFIRKDGVLRRMLPEK